MTDTMTRESQLSRSEKSSWATGLGGQTILFGLQLSFTLFAFVEILGLLPAAVARSCSPPESSTGSTTRSWAPSPTGPARDGAGSAHG